MISSRQNPLFKQFKSLSTRSGRAKSGLYLLEGVRLVEEAIAAGISIEHAVYSSHLERNQRGMDCLEAIVNMGVSPQLLADKLLCELASTERPQGILVTASLPSTLASDAGFWSGGRIWLVIDGVQDPGNLGTILRTAEALGVERVVALKGTVDPYNEKVIRSAMGAIFRLPIVHEQDKESVLAKLQQYSVQLVVSALDQSVPYNQVNYAERLALVVGNEGAGVAPFWLEAADLVVQIPILGQAESLNVAVATGILLAKVVENRS